jgi:hypothetical protein
VIEEICELKGTLKESDSTDAYTVTLPNMR